MPPADTLAYRKGWRGVVDRVRKDLTLRREADTMGFYVSIALLAALMAGNDHRDHSNLQVFWVVWGTTFGLALAHWFAILLATRLVHDPDSHHTAGELLYAQMVMAVFLAVIATVAVLLVPADFDYLAGRLSAALFIGVLVVYESRKGDKTPAQAAARGIAALLIGFAVATIKWSIGK